MRIVAMAVMGAIALTTSLWAQSLGELAAQEKERRKGQSTHVITEQDLARARGGTYSQPEGQAAAPESSEAAATGEGGSAKEAATGEGGSTIEAATKPEEKPKTEEEMRTDKRSDWQARQKKTREQVNQLTQRVNELQLQANDMATNQFGPGRARLIEQLDKAKQELAAAQKQLQALEEERRRAGFR